MSAAAGQVGTIYLLHFDRPYKHARHYVMEAREFGNSEGSLGGILP